MSSKARLWIAAGIVGVIAIVGAVLSFMMMSPPADLDLAREKATAKGLYSVAIEPEGGALAQNEMHAWILTVKTPAGAPVPGATVAVDGGMPQHGHGLPTNPQATEIGEGRYRVEGVRFNMSGWWELKFKVTGSAGEDDVVFNIVL
jgi:hypothetical protein